MPKASPTTHRLRTTASLSPMKGREQTLGSPVGACPLTTFSQGDSVDGASSVKPWASTHTCFLSQQVSDHEVRRGPEDGISMGFEVVYRMRAGHPCRHPCKGPFVSEGFEDREPSALADGRREGGWSARNWGQWDLEHRQGLESERDNSWREPAGLDPFLSVSFDPAVDCSGGHSKITIFIKQPRDIPMLVTQFLLSCSRVTRSQRPAGSRRCLL